MARLFANENLPERVAIELRRLGHDVLTTRRDSGHAGRAIARSRMIGSISGVGVPGVYFAGRLASGMLVGVSPFDPPTLAAVFALLTVTALIACYIPARRVGGIEPADQVRRGD